MILTGTPSARSPLILEQEDLSETQLSALFSTFQEGSKGGLAFIPAILRPCPEACAGSGVKCAGRVSHRLACNVTHMTALVVDLDHVGGLPPPGAHECYWWETYSYSNDNRCYRLVYPFSSPLPISSPGEWSEGTWPALMEALGFATNADAACRDPARLYYTPRKPPGTQRRAGYVPGVRLLPLQGQGKRGQGQGAPRPTIPPPPERTTAPVDLDRFRAGLGRVKKDALAPIARAILQGTALTPPPGKRAPGQPSRYSAWLSATALVANLAEGWEDSAPLLELLRPSYLAEVADCHEDHTDWEIIPPLLETARANSAQYKVEKTAKREAAKATLRHGLADILGQGEGSVGKEGAPPIQGGSDDAWAEELQMASDKEGNPRVKPSAANVELVLRCSGEWHGVLRYNELTHNVEIFGGPIPKPASRAGHAVRDTDAARVADWFSRGALGMTLADSVIWSRMLSVAEANPYDPLKDSLPKAAEWDGVSRVRQLFFRYYGAVATPLLEALSEKFMIQLVARALDPGCQADTVAVLEGAQGSGKTSSLRILGGPFYTDAALDPHNKDSAALASGFHIIELGELHSLRRADVTALKQFITKTHDDYRPPYGRCTMRFPRHCVFVGTTNDPQYLVDTTGNRRWWPVACGVIDTEALKRDRTQLFAEARAFFEAGKQWHLSAAEGALAQEETDARMLPDSVAEAIEDYVLGKSPESRPAFMRTQDVCRDVLGVSADRGLEIKIGNAFRRLKFKRVRVRISGLSRWVYELPEALRAAPKQERKSLAAQMAELRQ
jgi:predicted P-loop ATPase